MRNEIHSLIYEREYDSDEDPYFEPYRYDLISYENISKRLLNACIESEAKKSLEVLKKYNCIYTWLFITKIIEKNKIEFLSWFIKNLYDNGRSLKDHDIFTMYYECNLNQNCEMLKFLRFDLNLKISKMHLSDFIERASYREYNELLKTLKEIQCSL